MYDFNIDSPNMVNDPNQWENLPIEELFKISDILTKRYNICLAEYPTLAPQILNGLKMVQHVLNKKRFEGLGEDDI